MGNVFQKKAVRSLLITGGILLVEIMLLTLLIAAVSKNAADALERKNLFTSLQNEERNFGALERDAQKVRSFLPTLQGALPDQEDLIAAIENIDRIGTDLHIPASFSLGNVQQPSSITGVQYIEYTLTLNGNYASLRTYLEALRNQSVFISVDSVSLSDPTSIFAGGAIQLRGKLYTR